jgi:hypothetical protein
MLRQAGPVALLCLLYPVCACLVACASSPPPGPSNAPDTASLGSSAAPAISSAPAESSDPPARAQRPLDLVNNCPHDAHVYYGEQPGDGKGQTATVATGATVPVPRGADGTVVVWVVDDKGFGLASVHVTRRMHHVRFDAACSRIDAD